jgi:hypothetical protein
MNRQPQICEHSTGQARVTLNGRVHYLGKHGTPESLRRYQTLISEWDRRGRAPIETAACVVAEMLQAYEESPRADLPRQVGRSTRIETVKSLETLWRHRWTDTLRPEDLDTVQAHFQAIYPKSPKSVAKRMRHVLDVVRFAGSKEMMTAPMLAELLAWRWEAPTAPPRRNARRQKIYRMFDAQQCLLYVGISGCAIARMTEHAKEKGWFDDVRRIEIESIECSRQEIEAFEAAIIYAENPKHNRSRPRPRGDGWARRLGITIDAEAEHQRVMQQTGYQNRRRQMTPEELDQKRAADYELGRKLAASRS